MRDHFTDCHPTVNLLFFIFVIGMTVVVNHPVIQGISLVSAGLYCCLQHGIKETGKLFLRFIFPVMLIAAVINPLCNHYGVTVLYYFRDGNPLTLESLVYGLVMACMLCAVLLWFRCCIAVLSTDKWIYLTGRAFPAISLIMSMSLRFFPIFVRRGRMIDDGRKCIGKGSGTGSFADRFRHAAGNLSILITWSLEKAIITSDSMKARGYGIKGRSSFALYRITAKDKGLLLAFALPAAGIIAACGCGFAKASYDPRIRIGGGMSPVAEFFLFMLFAILCLMPVIFDLTEHFSLLHALKRVQKSDKPCLRVWERL